MGRFAPEGMLGRPSGNVGDRTCGECGVAGNLTWVAAP